MKHKIEILKQHIKPGLDEAISIFNLRFCFITNRTRILEAFKGLVLWNELFVEDKGQRSYTFYLIDTKDIKLDLEFDVPSGYSLIKKIGEIEYFRNSFNQNELFIRIFKNIRFYINLADKLIFGALVLGEIYSEDFIAQFIISPVLDLFLRINGYFSIHASAVKFEGSCFLFPAEKESGKSTISIFLAEKGFQFMGDETIYVKKDKDKVKLLAFPRQIKLYNDAVKFFPKLKKLPQYKNTPLNRFKIRFPVDKVFDFKFCRISDPGFIIFLSRSDKVDLRPKKKLNSLRDIFPESAEFITKEMAKNYLDTIHQLIERSKSYYLTANQDLETVYEKVIELL